MIFMVLIINIVILLLYLLLIFETARLHEKLSTLMIINEKVIIKTLLLRVWKNDLLFDVFARTYMSRRRI